MSASGAPWVLKIRRCRVAMEESVTALREAVAAARSDGQSWTTVGRGLGVSRQSAWQTWAHRIGEEPVVEHVEKSRAKRARKARRESG